ncbi:MAG: biotin--[acetyl-CoA-carboxylase] ligase [Dysgonamonadaceae bacterium]|jgi:BirA family biotin operon repressor/biotin-[acetyl-CoA-carboxylase] ligase|nr:biotin--[acetyl-CoA-carboxylase] ligase [Dysgonamonadaceae bacterium]
MMNIIKIESTASTNLLLKEWSKERFLEEGTVLFTNNQTAGRGQAGTSWEAESGKNITCSLLLYPVFLSVKQHFFLSEIAALGVKEILDDYVNNVTVKWPNDIYFEDRKLVGILIENELSGRGFSQSVIGIGLNVNQEIFTSNAPNPVSLKQITGMDFDLDILVEKITRRILYWYDQLKEGRSNLISQTYQDFLYRKNGFHRYEDKNGPFNAKIQFVADNGFLHLTTDKGEDRSYAFKEISFVK